MMILRIVTSLLAAATALLHIVVGGADTLAPWLDRARATDLAPAIINTMQACWHIVSVVVVVSVPAFLVGGRAGLLFALVWLGAALAFVGVGLQDAGPGGLWITPQWTLLGLTGLLGVVSARGGR